jgi:peptide-methionine (S)-S-oxide reductase
MLFNFAAKKLELPSRETATKDRAEPVKFNPIHFVNGNPFAGEVPAHLEKAVFGLGCFWGAERLFWELSGVYSTAAGYSGGYTANPNYEEVCSGNTAHTEAVLVYFDPKQISYAQLLTTFWESHDPTQGMRQGNDLGTQYRSAIYTTTPEQEAAVDKSKELFQRALSERAYSEITTEIRPLEVFYYAEEYHQQYLAKNPAGYCGLAGTGACLQPLI